MVCRLSGAESDVAADADQASSFMQRADSRRQRQQVYVHVDVESQSRRGQESLAVRAEATARLLAVRRRQRRTTDTRGQSVDSTDRDCLGQGGVA